MTTFRERLFANGIDYKENDSSSLDVWFSDVVDTPFDALSAADIARAIRQGVFLPDMLPLAKELLRDDPLVGDYYDGEIIAAIASLSYSQLKDVFALLKDIHSLLCRIDTCDVDDSIVKDIEKINLLVSGCKI